MKSTELPQDSLNTFGLAPGTRVRVFDPTLYKDDVKTPLSHTVRPATVVRHYGRLAGPGTVDHPTFSEGSLVDVLFDHRPERPSCGHFTRSIDLIPAR